MGGIPYNASTYSACGATAFLEKIMIKRLFLLILVAITLAACGGDSAINYELGELLVEYTFDDEDIDNDGESDWDTFAFEVASINFGFLDEAYITTSMGGGYIWAQNRTTYQDIVIEVSTDPKTFYGGDSVYGIVCRAHPTNNNMGYYFLIRGDGSFGIRQGDGTQVKMLHRWTKHDAIRIGEKNTIRAVCIDNYFAMYINGKFAGEVTDNWFEEGRIAFAINSTEGVPIAISYDNLKVWEATKQ